MGSLRAVATDANQIEKRGFAVSRELGLSMSRKPDEMSGAALVCTEAVSSRITSLGIRNVSLGGIDGS